MNISKKATEYIDKLHAAKESFNSLLIEAREAGLQINIPTRLVRIRPTVKVQQIHLEFSLVEKKT